MEKFVVTISEHLKHKSNSKFPQVCPFWCCAKITNLSMSFLSQLHYLITHYTFHPSIHQLNAYDFTSRCKPNFLVRKVLKHMIKHIQAKRLKGNTNFQPSGSRQATILVLIPGKGPGSRIIFLPHNLIASAVL